MPSKIELRCYLEDRSFIFYTQEECFAINHNFNICNNVKKLSVVVICDNLTLSLTKVKISLHEKLLDWIIF